jgi:thiamine-phosphate pyrophosphorylase
MDETMEEIKYRGCLQFITHKTERYTELQEAEMALQGGCRWVQLRMKNAAPDDILRVGREMRQLCDKYSATLIIDDHVELVKEISADGVHLGLSDMPIDEARQVFGEEYIIGGTANTAEQALMHYKRSADYVGCGPLRFTQTKEKLAPTLGADGLAAIMSRLHNEHVTMPVVAIGGIGCQDTGLITDTGVDGIAVSGAIVGAPDPVAETQRLVRLVNEQCSRNRK